MKSQKEIVLSYKHIKDEDWDWIMANGLSTMVESVESSGEKINLEDVLRLDVPEDLRILLSGLKNNGFQVAFFADEGKTIDFPIY